MKLTQQQHAMKLNAKLYTAISTPGTSVRAIWFLTVSLSL